MCSINEARQVKTKYLPIISRLQMNLPNKSVGHIGVGQKVVENYTFVITSSSEILSLSVHKGAIRCKSYKINNVLSIVVRTYYIINGSWKLLFSTLKVLIMVSAVSVYRLNSNNDVCFRIADIDILLKKILKIVFVFQRSLYIRVPPIKFLILKKTNILWCLFLTMVGYLGWYRLTVGLVGGCLTCLGSTSTCSTESALRISLMEDLRDT
jgi:hypothetical protein